MTTNLFSTFFAGKTRIDREQETCWLLAIVSAARETCVIVTDQKENAVTLVMKMNAREEERANKTDDDNVGRIESVVWTCSLVLLLSKEPDRSFVRWRLYAPTSIQINKKREAKNEWFIALLHSTHPFLRCYFFTPTTLEMSEGERQAKQTHHHRRHTPTDASKIHRRNGPWRDTQLDNAQWTEVWRSIDRLDTHPRWRKDQKSSVSFFSFYCCFVFFGGCFSLSIVTQKVDR